jgi:hypothetical protein
MNPLTKDIARKITEVENATKAEEDKQDQLYHNQHARLERERDDRAIKFAMLRKQRAQAKLEAHQRVVEQDK